MKLRPRPGSTPGTPARLRGRRLRRQVSWLADHRLRAAFPGKKRPVAIGRRLIAHSCGDSRGFGAGPAPHSLLALPFAGEGPSQLHLGRGRHACQRALISVCGCPKFGYELTVGGSRKGAKRECGEDSWVQSRGCPRNCKRRVRPKCHWRFSAPGRRVRASSCKPGDLPSARTTLKALGWRAKGMME